MPGDRNVSGNVNQAARTWLKLSLLLAVVVLSRIAGSTRTTPTSNCVQGRKPVHPQMVREVGLEPTIFRFQTGRDNQTSLFSDKCYLMVRRAGIEPATKRLKVFCYYQLSYQRIYLMVGLQRIELCSCD